MESFTLTQKRAVVFIPRFTGALSMCGSVFIASSVLLNRKKRRRTYHRLMLGMSASDLIVSVWNILSSWPVPENDEHTKSAAIYGAGGTQGTCTAQGFFTQYGIAVPLYNASLAIYYLLVISFNWKERRVKKIERWMHGCALIVAIGTAIICLPLRLYNLYIFSCWIAAYPMDCRKGDSDEPCERGEHALLFQALFYALPLYLALIGSTVAMIKVYLTVREQEKKAQKWRHGRSASTAATAVASSIISTTNTGPSRSKMTSKVAWQAFFYLLTFYLTWTPAVINGLVDLITGGERYFGLSLLMAIFFPLQGFLNFLVYIRPRCIRYCKHHPDVLWVRWFRCTKEFIFKERTAVHETGVTASLPVAADDELENDEEEFDPSVRIIKEDGVDAISESAVEAKA